MKEDEPEIQEPQLGLNDLAFILFKHKRLILWSTLTGLLAALVGFLFWPPPYVSECKLLVRYVLDRSVVDPQESQVRAPDATYNDNLITAEKEILSSWDLAAQVAETISNQPTATLSQKNQSVHRILADLSVTGTKGSNVISVTFKDPNPLVAKRALEELINRYFVKHLEVHRSTSAFEYVAQESSQAQARLRQIEAELKEAKDKAGIISLKESSEIISKELARSQESLNTAEEETVAQRARVTELEKLMNVGSGQASPAGLQANRKEFRTYQALSLGVVTLRQKELDLLSRFTAESQMVKTNQAQIGVLEDQQRDMEKRYPGLLAAGPDGASRMSLFDRNPQLDLIAERAALAALEEKTRVLKEHYRSILERSSTFSQMAPEIAGMERKRELQETNYKYFQESLDKARIDEALDPKKIPNISIVQKPTPALRSSGSRNKILLGLGGGGLALGLTIAFLMELVFDRTLKRPVQLEAMNIPRLISVPDWTNQLRLPASTHGEVADPEATTTDPMVRMKSPWSEFMRPYGAALRDRLTLYFQLKNMIRKPKLIALTGCSNGAGTSTIAGALAAAFAETGEGKVLFVNMKSSPDDIHPLFDANTSC